MEKTIFTFLAVSLILISCEKRPTASFTTDSDEWEVGQTVFFYNNSNNGERFEWDFGDGYTSNDRDPVHIFTSTGTYEVTLTAISKSGQSDKTSLTISIMVPTLLEVEVREYYSEDTIPNASIILYPTLADWDAQTNMVVEGITDQDGIAVFSNLDPGVYYVDVWEATHDNYTLRNEDPGFVTTPQVSTHKIVGFIAWVDVVAHTKGEARGTRPMIVKKLERNAVDKGQPSADAGTDYWQEVYNRTLKK
jgi:PKD repeat protein